MEKYTTTTSTEYFCRNVTRYVQKVLPVLTNITKYYCIELLVFRYFLALLLPSMKFV